MPLVSYRITCSICERELQMASSRTDHNGIITLEIEPCGNCMDTAHAKGAKEEDERNEWTDDDEWDDDDEWEELWQQQLLCA